MNIFKKISLIFSECYLEFIIRLPAVFSKIKIRYYNRLGSKIEKKGVYISPNVRIRGKITMGEGSSLAQNCSVSNESASIIIGRNVMIAPNVCIISFSHGIKLLEVPMVHQENTHGDVIIEDNVWVGANCTIAKGVTIGEGSIIAANSFVNKNIPPFSIAGGVPAKIIKSRKNNIDD